MRQQRMVRVVSILAAGALTAGTFGAVLVSSTGVAGADTPSYSSTCAGTPLGTISSTVKVTGSLPASVKLKKSFTLSKSGMHLTISSATLLGVLAGQTLGGTVVTSLAATGAKPATQTITYTFPPTTIPTPAPASVTLVGTGSATSYKASKAGKVVIRTTGSSQVSFAALGSTFGPYTCTSSPASNTIAKTVAR